MANSTHILRISTSTSNKGVVRNKEMTWAKLCEYLSRPLEDTKHTLAQYKELSADQRADLKSKAGHYLGGHSRDGLRRKASISLRSLLCFDLDELTVAQYREINSRRTGISKYEFFLHSTRSHTAEKPKMRLLVPLATTVTPEVFNILSRYVAKMILFSEDQSLNAVDPVSYRLAQMMYFPTTCKDATYIHRLNEGELLDAKNFLGAIDDWENLENLPYGSKYEKPRVSGSNLKDPRAKTGIIGAFCRSYDIESAIETFLPEIYTPVAEQYEAPRYSYLLGSSSNGAVVYDHGAYLYSHHSSDPCGEKCVNSFDLVRIHKFGNLDQDTNGNLVDLESFAQMCAFLKDDELVQSELSCELADHFELDDVDEAEEETPNAEAPVQELTSVPTFPMEVFSPFWREQLESWADATAAPVDYVVWSLLTCTGAAIGNARWVQATDSWKEPPILWTQIVGAPSVNKSPAMSLVLGLFDNLAPHWDCEFKVEMAKWHIDKKIAERVYKKWEKEVDKPEHLTPEMPLGARVPPKPERKVLLVSDVTPESIVHMSRHNPKGLLLYRDELAGWYSGFGKYNSSGASERGMWLETYGGRRYLSCRLKDLDEAKAVDHFNVSILGTTQPCKLLQIYESDVDGFFERFIPIWPEPVHAKLRDTRVDLSAARVHLETLVNLRVNTSEDKLTGPYLVPLAPDAQTRFLDWVSDFEGELYGIHLGGIVGKAKAQALRIALILTYLEWSADPFIAVPEPTEVSCEVLDKAIRIIEDYLMPMHCRARMFMNESPLVGAAIEMCETIISKNTGVFSRRDVYRTRVGKNANVVEILLEVAQGLGICEKHRPKSSEKQAAHRPAETYKILARKLMEVSMARKQLIYGGKK